MKNVINYYYNIILNQYKKRDNSFIFEINNIEYEFIEYYGDINKLLSLYSTLKSYRKKTHEIIINKNGNFITYYENKPYILLKKIINDRKKIEITDIIEFDMPVYTKQKLKWKELWENKVDYYELQIEETGLKYPLLKESFNYYKGLSEIAINLLNYVDYDAVEHYVTHKRIETIDDLFNPLNIIIDNKTRDIAEYIKVNFFTDNIDIDEVTNFIKSNLFLSDEIILLLSRLLYPSYYFDMYEKFYRGNNGEKDLEKIIKKNAEFEAFLKSVYNDVKVLYKIPQIEFLEF